MKKNLFIALVVPFLISGCGSPRVASYHPDAEMERNALAAKSAYTAGAIERASVFYQKALNRARLADQPAEIARLAYNLAACRAQMQKYSEALELLDEARFESSGAGVDFPEAVLLRAEILYRLGQTNEALATAKSGLDALDNSPRAAQNQRNNPVRLQFQVFLAESACDRNDGKLALKELEKADVGLLKISDSAAQAQAAQARGRALLLEKQPAGAAACFDNAAALYQKAQRYADMALALQKAGDAYEMADKRREAFKRHYRAARSLFVYGDNARAQKSLAKATGLAGESGDKEMLATLARLKTEILPEAGNETASPKSSD
jgi:tetratricopeptide (TPR) repeat protein